YFNELFFPKIRTAKILTLFRIKQEKIKLFFNLFLIYLNPYFNELLLTSKLTTYPFAGANIDTFFHLTTTFFAFF
ncbi:hypothetical protein Q4517_14970, partial [Tenacibaculum sp. 1_MG-2023]|uniref:hypothetical protein n=1 Tax=Tenacibaculum sp. 1_MG-2023 TaxID=3062653 RepID=UPI0026E35DA5